MGGSHIVMVALGCAPTVCLVRKRRKICYEKNIKINQPFSFSLFLFWVIYNFLFLCWLCMNLMVFFFFLLQYRNEKKNKKEHKHLVGIFFFLFTSFGFCIFVRKTFCLPNSRFWCGFRRRKSERVWCSRKRKKMKFLERERPKM